MFAPRLARKPMTAASPAGRLLTQRPMLPARPFGRRTAEPPGTLQRGADDHTLPPGLWERTSSLTANEPANSGTRVVTPKDPTTGMTRRHPSWDFSRIPNFPSDRPPGSPYWLSPAGSADFPRIPNSAATRGGERLTAGDQIDESQGATLGGNGDGVVPDAQTQTAGSGSNAVSISTSDLSAAQWMNSGQFKWWIKWTTSGTNGWIVQNIANGYSGTLADGSPISVASVGATPSYYEAWAVDGGGGITGSLGGTGNRDRWERPSLGAGSQGNWSMRGTVYWTAADPAQSGFTSGGVRDAGSLLSSTTAPAGIGSPLLSRGAFGAWHSDGTPALPGCVTT